MGTLLLDAGYLHTAIVPSQIAVDEAGQCELADFIAVSSKHSCDPSDPEYEQKKTKESGLVLFVVNSS